MGRGIEREGLFFSLRRRLLNEGAVIYNSPDFQGRREKSVDEPCTTTSKGEEIKVEPDGISQHSSHASPSSQTLHPELGWLRQIHLFPCSARRLQRMKGTYFLLPPWPWSSTLWCWLEYQEQAPDDCGNWLLSLYLLSQEAETIFPALESGLGLWLALTDGMKLRPLQVSPFQPPQ